jgi:hypothetical protein
LGFMVSATTLRKLESGIDLMGDDVRKTVNVPLANLARRCSGCNRWGSP